MVSYPGENSDIPKTLSGVLLKQPLNYLIPKGAIADLVDSQLSISVPLKDNIFHSNHDTELSGATNIDLGCIDQDTTDPVIFKRPENWEKFTNSNKVHDEEDLTEGLSQFATTILKKNAQNIGHINIKAKDELDKYSKVHSREDYDLNSSFNLGSDISPKRLKISSDISINQSELATQYFKELLPILEVIKKNNDTTADVMEDQYAYNYIRLPDHSYVMNENFVLQISQVIVNITTITNGTKKLDQADSKLILNALLKNVENIKEEFLDFGANHEILFKTIAYISIATIFSILQLHYEDTQFHLERYVLTPLNFLKERIFNLNNTDSSDEVSLTELSLLHRTIAHLPGYIEKHTFIGEGLATMLNYTFSELIMNFNISSTDVKTQHYWEELKAVSVSILVALFQFIPDQRIFIIEDLLTHMENLPVKRLQKKLRKIGNGKYLSDFTICIMQMLESIQQGSFCNEVNEITTEIYSTMLTEYTNNMKELATLIDHIHNIIFEKFKVNPANFRHVISNYITDLLNVLCDSAWPIAEELLSSIMKRLLVIFEPNSNNPAAVESMSLQLLNTIGSEIFDIKCSMNVNDRHNLIEVFNSPKELPNYVKKFHLCLSGINQDAINQFGKNYLWNKFIFILVRLKEYENEGEDSKNKLPTLIHNELNNRLTTMLNKNQSANTVSEAYCSILHSFELINLYDLYLKLVVSLLSKDKIKLRSTAIRCLSNLASRDQSILTSPTVKETIIERLTDSSASVKDAILDLVSIGSASLHFYKQINHNFDDESLMVRKHVLKINENLYDLTDDIEIKIFIASRILLKLEDEEDAIIENSRQILMKKWILSIVNSHDQPEKQVEVCDEVLQVMAGVAIRNEKCNELYDWFLNFYLLEKEEHSELFMKQIMESLNKSTDYLVHKIVELQSIDIEDPKMMVQKKNYLNLLAKFSDSVLTFITKDHITALYPYLFTSSQSTLQLYILCVFKDLMSKLDNFKPKFLYDMETIILSRLPKMSIKETEEAMPLVWCIAEKRDDYSRVSKACNSCFSHIVPFITKATSEPESIILENKLQRLIYLATGFARFCDSKKISSQISYLKENEFLFEYVAKCLLVLSNKRIDHVIRRISIKNLIKLCSSYPKLFNSRHILNVFDEELKSGKPDIQLVIIEGLYDFFLQEEKKSIREIGVSRSFSSTFHLKANSKKPHRSSNINDGLCSALVSRFLKYILKICLSTQIQHSIVSLRCLRVILQFGYTNPSHCIPTVIGLLSSSNPYLHKLSTKILVDLAEKYETMILNGISQGMQIATEYSFVTEDLNYYKNDQVLRKLQMILSEGKTNSNKFFKIVLRLLNKYTGNITHANLEESDMRPIIFICCNISLIEFPTYNELLTILKSNSVTTEQIRELIIDEIDDTPSKMELKETYKNAIITEYTLRNLNQYFIDTYELRKDILILDESELHNLRIKTISLPENSDLRPYSNNYFNYQQMAKERKFYNTYLSTVEDED